MNLYIDVGAYKGDTADCYKLFGFDADYKIAVEPNIKLKKYLDISDFDEVMYTAAWIEDGEIEFYLDDSPEPVGSTIMSSKTSGNLIKTHKVPVFDLIDLISLYDEDTILLKLDCEGAEFKILERLMELELLPNLIRVEFHPNKIPEYTTTYKNELFNKIKTLGVDIEEWH